MDIKSAVEIGQKFLLHLQKMYKRVKEESTKPDYKIYMSPDLQTDLLQQITALQTLIDNVTEDDDDCIHNCVEIAMLKKELAGKVKVDEGRIEEAFNKNTLSGNALDFEGVHYTKQDIKNIIKAIVKAIEE